MNYAPRELASLTIVIYDRKTFTVQATEVLTKNTTTRVLLMLAYHNKTTKNKTNC
jgi:hypothetical protein